MKSRSLSRLGAVLGSIAIIIGVVVLCLWFIADAKSVTTAVAAISTIVIGAAVLFMHGKYGVAGNDG